MPGKIKNALCRGAKTYSPYELQMAVGYVKQRRMGLNEAVRYYNIPYSTLRDHVQGLKGNGKPGPPATPYLRDPYNRSAVRIVPAALLVLF